MKILITGANGMLAQAIKEQFGEGNELILTDVAELDITDEEKTKSFVQQINPDLLINCAGYTAVDNAESDVELATKINADGPKNLAKACKKIDCVLVHISTDYVFGGNKDIKEDYSEEDAKAPESVYGSTKLDGEINIQSNYDKYYIFRTAWLYGEGKNFIRTMLKLGEERDEVSVVNDQHGSPTYSVDLANIIYQVINKKLPYGIYNSTNQGFITWYEFTKEIFALAGINCKVNPVTSEQFASPAKRPKNSQLSKAKLLSYGIEIPTYENGLKRYLKKEGKI